MSLFSKSEISDCIESMLYTARWTSSDLETGSALADTAEISAETRAQLTADLLNFLDGNAADLEESGLSSAQVGYDFHLTRNRHGAGFWDRGLGSVGVRLSEAAHIYGEAALEVADDGMLRAMDEQVERWLGGLDELRRDVDYLSPTTGEAEACSVAADGTVTPVMVTIVHGDPGLEIVGVSDKNQRERRDRWRAAILNAGFEWPDCSIRVDLGTNNATTTDAAVAVAILRASSQIEDDDHRPVTGELGLDGTVRRPVR